MNSGIGPLKTDRLFHANCAPTRRWIVVIAYNLFDCWNPCCIVQLSLTWNSVQNMVYDEDRIRMQVLHTHTHMHAHTHLHTEIATLYFRTALTVRQSLVWS